MKVKIMQVIYPQDKLDQLSTLINEALSMYLFVSTQEYQNWKAMPYFQKLLNYFGMKMDCKLLHRQINELKYLNSSIKNGTFVCPSSIGINDVIADFTTIRNNIELYKDRIKKSIYRNNIELYKDRIKKSI